MSDKATKQPNGVLARSGSSPMSDKHPQVSIKYIVPPDPEVVNPDGSIFIGALPMDGDPAYPVGSRLVIDLSKWLAPPAVFEKAERGWLAISGPGFDTVEHGAVR